MPPLNNRIADMVPEITGWRHWLHQNPELQFELPKTTAYIAERLREIGVDALHEGIGKTGMVAVIHGASAGPTIALRADMDALPIDELSDADHASQTPGNMHACGHDGHSAMLLGAAKYLTETRRFAGTVALIFQPAEEGDGGAKAMVDDDVFDRFDVREVYGMHNMPNLPVGQFGLCKGSLLAAVDFFYVDIVGKGGHASAPHLCDDPLVAANAVYSAFQTIITRDADPVRNGLISITSIKAGEANNVIPQTATLKGTVRNLHEDTRDMVEGRMGEICEGIAKAHGVEIVLRYDRLCPVTINGDQEADYVADAAQSIVGSDHVDRHMPPRLAGEDFSYMLQERPGAMIFLGNGDSAGLHHPAYDFNDDAIGYGVEFWSRLVENRLPIEG